ncbi:hypothetical protein FNYG_10703 [Fusarium nygamai]|uniref:Uncharacterized protein n=1 Tax=Gibberella nygamai TaxID=42673 RepID=A0A2K0W0Q4_GIBNY|nr:hypothetical protein FNYG_10703 [Fusarium nygamai]
MLGRKETIIPYVPLFSTVLLNKRDGGLMDKKPK